MLNHKWCWCDLKAGFIFVGILLTTACDSGGGPASTVASIPVGEQVAASSQSGASDQYGSYSSQAYTLSPELEVSIYLDEPTEQLPRVERNIRLEEESVSEAFKQVLSVEYPEQYRASKLITLSGANTSSAQVYIFDNLEGLFSAAAYTTTDDGTLEINLSEHNGRVVLAVDHD